ncbi:MAG: DUF1257 domain-containing protein [Candidatus Paceibacterota bacterium]|jgi:hypothetical protein
MSHVVAIQLEVKDLQALETAAKALGAELVRDQKTFRWYGRWMNDYSADNAAYRQGIKPENYGKCDHIISHPQCSYDIGLVKQPNGSFRVVADEWSAGGLTKVFGQGMAHLKQRYGVAVATKTMRNQGWSTSEKQDQNGNVRLVCTKR